MKQAIDVRADVPQMVAAADDARAWEAECHAARAAMTTPFIVAPRMSVATVRGVLTAGMPIEPDDFDDLRGPDGHHVPAWRRFRDLISRGHILERL